MSIICKSCLPFLKPGLLLYIGTLKKATKPVNIDPSVLTKFIGIYEGDAGHRLIISSDLGKLFADLEDDGAPGTELLPASDRIFYLPYSDAQVIFLITPENKVTHLIFLQSAMGDWILRKTL